MYFSLNANQGVDMFIESLARLNFQLQKAQSKVRIRLILCTNA